MKQTIDIVGGVSQSGEAQFMTVVNHYILPSAIYDRQKTGMSLAFKSWVVASHRLYFSNLDNISKKYWAAVQTGVDWKSGSFGILARWPSPSGQCWPKHVEISGFMDCCQKSPALITIH